MRLVTIEVFTLRSMPEHLKRVDVFRERLEASVRRSGLSRTEYAARAGIDRTTLTQLLSPANRRLPRLDTLLGIANAHNESIDWLAELNSSTWPRRPVEVVCLPSSTM